MSGFRLAFFLTLASLPVVGGASWLHGYLTGSGDDVESNQPDIADTRGV